MMKKKVLLMISIELNYSMHNTWIDLSIIHKYYNKIVYFATLLIINYPLFKLCSKKKF